MKLCGYGLVVASLAALVGCSSTTGVSSGLPGFTSGTTATGDDGPGTGIFGRVVDANGQPLPSAEVTLVDSQGRLLTTPTVTDAEGNYALALPPGGVPDGAYMRVSPQGGRPTQAPYGRPDSPRVDVQFQHDGSMQLHPGGHRP